jgi:cell division protein FtsX
MTFTVIILLVLLISLVLLLTAAIKRVQLTREQTQASINRIQAYLDKRKHSPIRHQRQIPGDLYQGEDPFKNIEVDINKNLEQPVYNASIEKVVHPDRG